MSRIWQLALVAVLACGSLGTASANSVFEGRLADGTASSSCTVSGAGKCAMFYDSHLNITILNDWYSGYGNWSATAAAGSSQASVASAGAIQTSFATGWVLPTSNSVLVPAGPPNQYLSIWNDVGGTFIGLQAQFDNVQPANYWSQTPYTDFFTIDEAWRFNAYFGDSAHPKQDNFYLGVAVRAGDVASAVPEPQSYSMLLIGLGAIAAAIRKRPR